MLTIFTGDGFSIFRCVSDQFIVTKMSWLQLLCIFSTHTYWEMFHLQPFLYSSESSQAGWYEHSRNFLWGVFADFCARDKAIKGCIQQECNHFSVIVWCQLLFEEISTVPICSQWWRYLQIMHCSTSVYYYLDMDHFLKSVFKKWIGQYFPNAMRNFIRKPQSGIEGVCSIPSAVSACVVL